MNIIYSEMEGHRNKRQINIELLRIFSMFLIILGHIEYHFLRELNLERSFNIVCMNYVMTFIMFHVDLFIIITGYFGIKHCKKTLLRTIILIYFYSIILGIISFCLTGHINLYSTLLPISSQTWWFMTMYTVMIMIAPLIETYLKVCNRSNIYYLTIGSLFINLYLGHFCHVNSFYDSGFGIINFVCVYILGAFIRKEGSQFIERLRNPRILIFLAIMVLIIIHYKTIPYFWKEMNEYCAPYPMFMATLIFCYFLKIRIPECFRKFIMFFSSSAIAVYLITDHSEIRKLLIGPFSTWYTPNSNSMNGLLIIFGSVFMFFLCSCVVDKIRIPITNFLYNKLSKVLFLD